MQISKEIDMGRVRSTVSVLKDGKGNSKVENAFYCKLLGNIDAKQSGDINVVLAKTREDVVAQETEYLERGKNRMAVYATALLIGGAIVAFTKPVVGIACMAIGGVCAAVSGISALLIKLTKNEVSGFVNAVEQALQSGN
ncbi:Uncharacterised protein [Candidatus Anstonella stagnisolia]|nr:Uncharacterised protein [Candidatus Anstonella stagnisolia]